MKLVQPKAIACACGCGRMFTPALVGARHGMKLELSPIPACEIAPVWERYLRAAWLAVRIWSPVWFLDGDPFDRISPRTAWRVAWGIHHDWRKRIRGAQIECECEELAEREQ